MKKEFLEFMNRGIEAPPQALERQILQSVKIDLSQLKKRVVQKFLVFHLFCGSLTLLVCPQFGFSPWGGSDLIMSFFMSFGKWGCAFFCGSFFLGVSTLVSLLLMTGEELLFLKRRSLVFIPVVSALSFAFFMMLKGVVVDLDYSFLWIFGASAVSVLLIQVGSRFRLQYFQF